jgi:glycosyltransferase involved in cell wall biosynthesis
VNQTNKTLIVLTPGFPANETDSCCLPAQQIFIKALNTNFNSLKIIIVSFQYPFISSVYQWEGNQVVPLNGIGKTKLSKLKTWWHAWKQLKKINKESQVIGLLSFWCSECALIGKYFGKKYKLKHYCWILGQDARKNNKFIKWINPSSGSLIAMSDFLAEEFYKNYHIKPNHIIPNGIDISLYPEIINARDIDVLGAGSLIPLKQYEIFLNIIKKLTLYFPFINSVICGKGPDKENLTSIILEKNLKDNINLTGEKPHQEVLQLMGRSKVFLHPSFYEGFPSVCLEALYAGAHVISFCRPMKQKIKNWYIVDNEEEMLLLALKILQAPTPDHHPQLPYPINNSAIEMMKLFDLN